jgi:transposase
VAQLLGVGDMRLWRTLHYYVAGARAQEDFSAVDAVGLDETAARRGHHDIGLFLDRGAGRLLFACEGRKAEVVARYSWARRCRLEPIKQVAKTLKDHWAGILNAFDSILTNGRVEGANSLVQVAKAKARGYGTVRHLITIAYLVAGKLTHLPASPFKLKVCAMPSS